MDIQAGIQGVLKLHHEYGGMLDAGLLVFARMLGFLIMAPVFNRKDFPFMIRLIIAIFFSVALLGTIPLKNPNSFAEGNASIFMLQTFINASIGMLLGFTADLVMKTVYAAGSFMNNQIGLSSAMIFDPSSRQQVMVMDRFYGMIGSLVFVQLGGFYWLVYAIQRSFTTFPLFETAPKIIENLEMDYLIHLSSNLLTVAVQLVAPVIVVTMAVDIILGIVNRTAQQIPVFQLSFALKPCIGIAVMLVTIPIFIQVLVNFFNDYSRFF